MPTVRHAGPRVSRGHCPLLEGCPSHLWTICDVALLIDVVSDRLGIEHRLLRGVAAQSPSAAGTARWAVSDGRPIDELASISALLSVA